MGLPYDFLLLYLIGERAIEQGYFSSFFITALYYEPVHPIMSWNETTDFSRGKRKGESTNSALKARRASEARSIAQGGVEAAAKQPTERTTEPWVRDEVIAEP
jgi:hypothetical protein